MRNLDLFHAAEDEKAEPLELGAQAWLFPGFALPFANAIQHSVELVLKEAPLRHMQVPSGHLMSAAMSNCGQQGWCSDRAGYRYSRVDPASGRLWPAMPDVFAQLAREAAALAGFSDFSADACLINCYQPGAKMSLHQDRDERDHVAPIVSVSLGMSAVFLWGGLQRSDKVFKLTLQHGDVLVWGGVDRLRYHGILPLDDVPHPDWGSLRFNLTLRKAE